MLSAFTFIHNALEGGYPIKEAIIAVAPFVDEIVIVDMESTDGTVDFIKSIPLSIRIIPGVWDYRAGETLANAHALNTECKYDTILHFEADEVFSSSLVDTIRGFTEKGYQNISVKRLQVEQNFQRIRWYPHWVHRVFPKGSVVKDGETTNKKDVDDMLYIDDTYGYLWDCTNCFRNNWLKRVENQAELRGEEINSLYVPIHANLSNQLEDFDGNYFSEEVWTSTRTPLDIPNILKPLLGKTTYE